MTEKLTDPGLYYGPPDKDNYCAHRYRRPGLRCPSRIDFYVKVPDGRGSDWRKARAACTDHLADVIWQMQADHGGYAGAYLLSASPPDITPEDPGRPKEHEEWCGDPALSRPADRCTCAITPEQQAAGAAHTREFWRLGRADQRRHLLDAHQDRAPRPGGTDLIARHDRAHEKATEGMIMSENLNRKRQDPDLTRKARCAEIGRELADAFNRGRTDPSLMAVNGHDTSSGWEFFTERDGEVYAVTIRRDGL